MKVPAKGTSRFLAQDDLDEPFVTKIADVRVETLRSNRGEEDKYILYFADKDIKPMVLNVLNRRRIIAAYGDESDDWQGKPLEVYVDPSVEMGGEVVGGIRVRIPAAKPAARPTPPAARPTQRGETLGEAMAAAGIRDLVVANAVRNATPPAASPRPTPPTTRPTPAAAVNRPARPQVTLADKLKQFLDGIDRCTTQAALDKWWEWADPIPFSDPQVAELTRGFHAAMERIALAQGPAAVAAGVDEDIPF